MKSSPYRKLLAMFASLALTAAFLGCDNNPAPVAGSVATHAGFTPNSTDAQRLSDGASRLMQAIKKPAASFHFSFKGHENLSADKTKPPQVGAVDLQADVAPEGIQLIGKRGSNTQTVKAKWGDQTKWDIASLTALGAMTSPTLVIAVGASVAPPPTTDLVRGTLADKFVFDTTTATSAQKKGLERARLVVSTIQDCKGTAWIATDSGLLIKFNIDAAYLDKNGHAWQEHYEGEVTPK